MNIVVDIEKWEKIEGDYSIYPGNVKRTAVLSLYGNTKLVLEIIELLKKAGYDIK